MSDNDSSSSKKDDKEPSLPSASSAQEAEAAPTNVQQIQSLSDFPSDEGQSLRGEENEENTEAASGQVPPQAPTADATTEPEQPPATNSGSSTASSDPSPPPPPPAAPTEPPATEESESASFHKQESSASSIFDRYAAVAEDQYSIMEEASTIKTHPSYDREDSSLQGGRLWKMAGEQVKANGEASQAPAKRDNLGPGARLAETIMERTRSRADPNALVAPVSTNKKYEGHPPAKMVAEDEAFLISTKPAHKRVRVVQLLIIGLVGLLVGWLGNFFVGSSCHFASVQVTVGQYGDIFDLHFGLWKYSPPDSALAGYTYCYPYTGYHQQDSPIVARITNLLALLAGTYSLVVLWWYLITGRAVQKYWRWAVGFAFLASLLQLFTLFFFLGHMCRSTNCSMGPASILAMVTAVAWAILGWELKYNMPVGSEYVRAKDDESVVTKLEMADLQGASQEYMERAFVSTPRSSSGYRPPELT